MTERERILAGGGEMGARMRALDWSQTPLGPVEGWPPALRTAVSVMLGSPYPVLIYWGPELVQLYNDKSLSIMGGKHPASLGAPIRRSFPEIWDVIGPMLAGVVDDQKASYLENQPLFLNRQGFAEEAYFTWSYIPIRDEHGRPVGIFVIASETTRQVLGERRFKAIRELSIHTASARDTRDVLRGAGEVLAQLGHDVPFALLYRVEGDTARLLLRSGVEAGARVAPEVLGLGDAASPWALADVSRSGEERLVEHLGDIHAGPWTEPVGRALLLPLVLGGGPGPDAVLVVGLSPRLPLDEGYRDFLRLLSRQLAADVARARALEQEQQRAEQLAELDRAKTAFFSNVSHEFRTPLTLMLGPLEDALATPERSLRGEELERVRRNASRLFKLVNSLLDFSRLEAGRVQVAFRSTDLAAFTTELVSHFESAAHRAGLLLTTEISPLSQPVWVDREAWEKIVFNLLSNALKYTFEGGLTVALREEEREVVLRVRDSGTGIPEDALPRLFERFQRVEGAQARSHEGSGIGLALVRELARLHGGEVSAHSVLGRGSTFTVRLPLGTAHLPPERLLGDGRPEPSAETDARAAPYVEEAQGWLGGRDVPEPVSGEGARARVLVVDDNADMRAYVTGLLAPSFEVEAVEDGMVALASARARAPALILSDVMMPRLGGFGLLREVRASPVLQGVPFLLLSARAGEEASVEGLEAGADDYLVKPFSARELLARVRSHLELAHMRREAVAHEARESSLEEAVRARDDFLSVASHELKTPLAALRLQFDTHERHLPAEVRAGASERLNAMRRQTQRLAALVETMLDVSLLATGQLQARRERVELTGLVADTVAPLREELERHGCTLELMLEPGLWGDFDVPRLGQVVRDLLANAVRYGPGQPVTVRLRRQDTGAVLEVVDHGIGVRPEQREHIFQRFGRAESARRYGGLGLGLWVARQVVEAHGGTLSVEDTPGGGATFTAQLPLPLDR